MKINPDWVFRKEESGEGYLFDPSAGKVLGLNPVSVLIWEHLQAGESQQQILDFLQKSFPDHAAEIVKDLADLIADMVRRKLLIE